MTQSAGRLLLRTLLLWSLLSESCCSASQLVNKEWKDPFEIGSPVVGPEDSNSGDSHPLVKTHLSSQSDLRLLRIVKSLLRIFQNTKPLNAGENYELKIKLRLSSSELRQLELYAEDPSASVSLRDVEDAVHSALSSAKPLVEETGSPPPLLHLPQLPLLNTEDLLICFIFGLILCLALAYFTGIVSWVKLVFGFIVLCSMWKWMQLRKSKQLDKDTACIPNDGWLSSWIPSSCSSNMKDQLMDATFEVTPMHAVIDTLSEMFLRPLPTFGDNLGKFFESFWGNNGFFSTMIGYGFLLVVLILIIPSSIFAFFYCGMPQRRRESSSSSSPPRKPRSRDSEDKIKNLEKEVQALTSTISVLREVSLQSMEYNISRRIEEMKSSRECARSVTLPVKHHPPIMEDNPPLKKLKSVEYPSYQPEEKEISPLGRRRSTSGSSYSEEGGGNKAVSTLSSDLILSPPSHFKNLNEKNEIGSNCTNVKEIVGGEDQSGFREEKKEDGGGLPAGSSTETLEESLDEDDDFEVISKSTPPPERNEKEEK